MTALTSWFRGRSAREQRMLLVMLTVAAPVLLWLLVWRPLTGALDAARERHAEAVERHGRVQAAAAALKGAGRPVAAPPGDLASYVGQAASNSGLSLTAADAQGPNRTAVTIASGDPRAMIGWLRGFEQQGLVVRELRMAPATGGSASLTAVVARPGR